MTVRAAARSLDPQALPRRELACALRRQLLAVEQVTPGRAVPATIAALGCVEASFGDQREPHRRERLDLTDHAVTAAMLSFAA